MTREDIENYEEKKVRTMDDFVAFCMYWDCNSFTYEWHDYGWEDNHKQIKYDRERLSFWVPFDKLDILTGQVLGNSYFEDGRYPQVNMYDGGVFISPDEVEEMLEWLDMDEEQILATFPKPETVSSYPDLSTEEKIDAYFKHLEELRIRPENSNVITNEDENEQDEEEQVVSA